MATPPSRPPRRLWRVRLLAIALATLVALVAAECGLQLVPQLLPAWFRDRYPPHGIEFFARGVLDRTPLTAVPLPYGVQPYDGPPPHQMVDLGVAALADTVHDRRDVPRLQLPADALGLPNRHPPTAPAVALVGDSFTFFAAATHPEGLQHGLEQGLGVEVLNTGISGIGPDQELFLLERVALPAKPRLVVWFFYGGNDLVDSFWMSLHRQQGIDTWGKLHAERRAPRLLLPHLLLALAGDEAEPSAGPLPGFVLARAPERRLWFHPDSVRTLAMPAELVTGNPGWDGVGDTLRRAKAACQDKGARLLVVFVPSQEQVYLPRIVPDPALLQQFAQRSNLFALPMPASADELWAAALQNRRVLETALATFCAAEGIEHWSATATLETFADADGMPPAYYATDSHWRSESQHAVATALCARIDDGRLLPR